MVEPIGPVDITDFASWLAAIPFAEWPQQHPAADGSLRPAMVTALTWHGFGMEAMPIVHALGFDESQIFQLMLSAVMPGQEIPEHSDEQPKDWLYRVHVPIFGNYRAVFRAGGVEHILMPGIAYKVNTRVAHAVFNRGATPRVHLMFDVMET